MTTTTIATAITAFAYAEFIQKAVTARGGRITVQFSELDGPVVPIEDDDADDEEDQFDRATAKFEAALATIMDWVADDPFEVLLEVISALGLKMADVAAWAQEQAELWADGDEPIIEAATPPAEHGEGKQPVTGGDDLAAAPEKNLCDEAKVSTPEETPSDQDTSGQAKDTLPAAPKPAAQENVAPVATADKTTIADDGGNGRRGDGKDLLSMVIKALKEIKGGLNLPDLTEKVVRAGYETESKNLAMAINNILGWLRNFGKVMRDDSAKEYSLVDSADLSHLHEKIVAYNAAAAEAKAAAAKVAEEERKQREKLLNDFAVEEKRIKAEKRLKSLQVVTESLPQATDLLTTAYASIAALSAADRANLWDAADKMYGTAENLEILLEIEPNKDFTPEVPAQSCPPDGCSELLAKAEKLLVQVDSRLRSIKLTAAEFSDFQADGQKMFDVALAIARAVGID